MNNYKIPAIIIVVFVLIMIINYQINHSVELIHEKNKQDNIILSKENIKINKQQKAQYEKQEIRAWKKTDPKELEKYGITITAKALEPTNQLEWESYISKNLEKSKLLEREEAKQAMEIMKTTPEDFRHKIEKAEEHVEIVKERLKEDPFNETYKEQLQNIYKMKAMATVLEKEVTSNEPYFISEESKILNKNK